MRSILFILAAFAFNAPAVAQSWEEYSYPEYAISVAFPARPQIETTTCQIADGSSVPARVYSVRQDKGALFDFMGRLFQIEAKVPPGGNEFELTRFQQSLVFERGVSNRSPEVVRAIREACPGLAGILNAAGNPVTPAGADDPRCQARR